MVVFSVCRGGFAIADASSAGGVESSARQSQQGSESSLRFSLQREYIALANTRLRTSVFASMAVAAHAFHVGPPNGAVDLAAAGGGGIVSPTATPLFSLAR